MAHQDILEIFQPHQHTDECLTGAIVRGKPTCLFSCMLERMTRFELLRMLEDRRPFMNGIVHAIFLAFLEQREGPELWYLARLLPQPMHTEYPVIAMLAGVPEPAGVPGIRAEALDEIGLFLRSAMKGVTACLPTTPATMPDL